MEPINNAYQLPVEEIEDRLQTDSVRGLNQEEATKRLRQLGENILNLRRDKNLVRILFDQFLSPLVYVLGFAAALAFIFEEWLEGVAILIVLLFNSLIGFFMEWQAVRSMEALRKLAQTRSRVFRGDDLREVASSQLVLGDLLYLEAGDIVPADCRVTEAQNLEVMEAPLTGESTPVEKNTEIPGGEVVLAERKNMLFKGTSVGRGNAKAIVIATGKNTELGAIAGMAFEAEKEATPLEKRLEKLSKKLIWLTLVLALLIFLLGVLKGRDLYLMVETAIALAIAAIPEGLPIVATIALARGMLRLARSNVIVKRLSAVQTLGETDIIFTDKTGTLTENKLSVSAGVFEFGEVSLSSKPEPLSGQNGDVGNSFAYEQIRKVGILCNNANLHDEREENPVGDPLEVALLRMAVRTGMNIEEVLQAYPREKEIPFDSDTKMMGTLHRNREKKNYLVCIKGALEEVLKESDHILTRDGKQPLKDREFWMKRADKWAARGLRTLAFAYSEVEKPEDQFIHNLVFIGLIGFLDPPREDVKVSMETCRKAGIRVIMVTGDHPETARNIAFKTGLTHEENAPVIHGKDLLKVSEAGPEEREKILAVNVFARVSPAQKLDLIRVYQQEGHVVGMTGDGINDAPALKKADIGIAMGKRGTEVAKEVADLVLENDAFPSIVLAIRQGRGIFENIRHFVVYLLSCNLSELLVVAVASFASLTMPLLPLQILFLNMVTDVFPALALGMSREPGDVMERPPRNSQESIIDRKRWIAIGGYAAGITTACIGILLLSVYQLGVSPAMGNNLVFYTLLMAQLWHVFNLPGVHQSVFRNEITTNRYIWIALALCLLITVGVYYIPVMRTVLSLQPISPELLSIAFAFSFLPVIFIQLLKRLRIIL